MTQSDFGPKCRRLDYYRQGYQSNGRASHYTSRLTDTAGDFIGNAK